MTCQSRELFRYENGRCINEDNVCNNVNNCGENSDEEQGCKSTGSRVWYRVMFGRNAISDAFVPQS